ncbi:hypothetical protein SDC9_110210 [bioreactor metagenome]|uniref:Uncharacterized protein n=1 Tax=bioreactor metagenome TaxID=1076179 RepID=A0A645BCY9_9ZZZZ
MLQAIIKELSAMNFYDYLQLLGGFILAGSYIPQIIKTYRIKKVSDISIAFWGFLFIGLSLMEVNALHLGTIGIYSYAITETANVFLCGVFLAQVIYYRKKNK